MPATLHERWPLIIVFFSLPATTARCLHFFCGLPSMPCGFHPFPSCSTCLPRPSRSLLTVPRCRPTPCFVKNCFVKRSQSSWQCPCCGRKAGTPKCPWRQPLLLDSEGAPQAHVQRRGRLAPLWHHKGGRRHAQPQRFFFSKWDHLESKSFSIMKKGGWVGGSGQNLSNLPGVFMFVYIFLGQPSAGSWLVAGGADPWKERLKTNGFDENLVLIRVFQFVFLYCVGYTLAIVFLEHTNIFNTQNVYSCTGIVCQPNLSFSYWIIQ